MVRVTSSKSKIELGHRLLNIGPLGQPMDVSDILGKIQVADSGSDQMGIWEAQTSRMPWNPAAENKRSCSACVCTPS